MHLPEASLVSRGLGCFGGELSARVHVVEREVAKHEREIVAERSHELSNGGLNRCAVGTFEVAVLDERDGCVGRTTDMVDFGIDGLGKVKDERFDPGSARFVTPTREQRYHPEGAPCHERREERRCQDPDLGVLERSTVEGDARDE